MRRLTLIGGAIALVISGEVPRSALGQLSSDQVNALRDAIGSRIEALTILGGDYGLSGGRFRSTGTLAPLSGQDADLAFTKLGGSGEIGEPKPLGQWDIGWQPRLQGNLGRYQTTNTLHVPSLEGDISTITGYGVEFGGGARFWASEHLSIATTLVGLYGEASERYTGHSAVAANPEQATAAGLINWKVTTWTGVAALDFQYQLLWDRTIVKFSLDPTYFSTQTLHSSNSQISPGGSSSTWAGKMDIDAPLGLQLFGHELRTGGYISHTQLSGGLRDGLGVNYLDEVHARFTLDLLQQLWKVKWAGIGASYIWGPGLKGWTAGADVTFQF